MVTTGNNIDALLEIDRLVRLMAVASGTNGIVAVVRAYLASWSKERIVRLQATDAGWAPFDEFQQPFTLSGADDVRQIRSSVRIRCRELEASNTRIAPELLELDLVLFFANESLDVHEPKYGNVANDGGAPEQWPARAAETDRNVIAAVPESRVWR